MTVSWDDFAHQVVASSLISADALNTIVSSSCADEPTTSGKDLARLLVKQKRLTAFQAKQIYAGKGKSLVLGNYVILDKLGQGGMGVVLKAEHRRMKRVVALKVLDPAVTRSPEVTRRFEREIHAAARLEHPNIVTAHDADEANGTHFLVMQYVEGADLAALVRTQGPLLVEQALDYILQAARGLEYAHRRGIVHRDIKPANLLLDKHGILKVLDMGLARLESAGAQQDQLTGTGQVMGTVDYMAPEQAMETKTADARADIYSLGVTLWYLLTGRLMYDGETVVKKLMAHQNSPVPSLQAICPQASPELVDLFARMVAKDPDARYQNMSDVITDLQRCLDGRSGERCVSASGSSRRPHNALRGPRDGGTQAFADAVLETPNASLMCEQPTVMLQGPGVDTNPTHQELTLATPGPRPVIARIGPGKHSEPRWPWVRSHKVWMAAGSGGLALLLLAAMVFLVKTRDGVIRVEINDPEIEVAIKDTDILLKQADQGKDIKLSPGTIR
ncbi:MAG: serine/threonine-protein kinase [Planctomycetaceae bacterium]